MDTAIVWTGERPAGLESQVRLSASSPVRVHATRRGTRPPAAPARPWIWVVLEGPIAPAALEAAVLGGAYDAVTLADPKGWERLAARAHELAADAPELPDPGPLVTRTSAMRELLLHASRAARTSMSVLLTGETGTGKELLARRIHAWSSRADRPFVPINCAAIPNDLMEAELFGYARGAFSGAVHGYDGLLMAAEGGTVFLDEIDDTPLPVQVKLLRVLEDRTVSRLGESTWRQVDFRIVAATNRDLRPLIAEGRFGADLYERLAILSLHLPPLRERTEDLPELVAHFVARFQREHEGSGPAEIRPTPEALRALGRYPWPGNVRELRNVIFQSLLGKRGGAEILLSDLPARILRPEPEQSGALVDRRALAERLRAGRFNLRAEVRALERAALLEALALSKGSAAEAARLLGEVGRGAARDPGGTVRAMMRRLGIGSERKQGT